MYGSVGSEQKYDRFKFFRHCFVDNMLTGAERVQLLKEFTEQENMKQHDTLQKPLAMS